MNNIERPESTFPTIQFQLEVLLLSSKRFFTSFHSPVLKCPEFPSPLQRIFSRVLLGNRRGVGDTNTLCVLVRSMAPTSSLTLWPRALLLISYCVVPTCNKYRGVWIGSLGDYFVFSRTGCLSKRAIKSTQSTISFEKLTNQIHRLISRSTRAGSSLERRLKKPASRFEASRSWFWSIT
jgi:hypothetical protein